MQILYVVNIAQRNRKHQLYSVLNVNKSPFIHICFISFNIVHAEDNYNVTVLSNLLFILQITLVDKKGEKYSLTLMTLVPHNVWWDCCNITGRQKLESNSAMPLYIQYPHTIQPVVPQWGWHVGHMSPSLGDQVLYSVRYGVSFVS